MSTLAEIEGAILELPPQQFAALREWIHERTESTVPAGEDAALEAALLASLESPRVPMDEVFFSRVRQLLSQRPASHAA